VGLCTDRSLEMIVALLAILKAGGACRCLTLALDVTLGPCPPPGA